MNTVAEVLEKLARARDREQMTHMWNAYTLQGKRNEKLMQGLMNIKEIARMWSKSKRLDRALSRRR